MTSASILVRRDYPLHSPSSPRQTARWVSPLTQPLHGEASGGAANYEYCYDVINNNACDGTWSKTTKSRISLGDLKPNTTYYWQVRARSCSGAVLGTASLVYVYDGVQATLTLSGNVGIAGAALVYRVERRRPMQTATIRSVFPTTGPARSRPPNQASLSRLPIRVTLQSPWIRWVKITRLQLPRSPSVLHHFKLSARK